MEITFKKRKKGIRSNKRHTVTAIKRLHFSFLYKKEKNAKRK